MEDKQKLIQQIVSSGRQVHAVLGPGFLESIYVRALVLELRNQGLSLERERKIKIWYGTQVVGTHRLDLIVDAAVIVEMKANSGIVAVHLAQLRSYLQATAYPLGLILNFGRPDLEWELIETTRGAETV